VNGAEIVVGNGAIVLGLDDGLLERLRRHAADVERTHGELCAGFADGLRGDDADSLAELHELTGRVLASVAFFCRRRGRIRR